MDKESESFNAQYYCLDNNITGQLKANFGAKFLGFKFGVYYLEPFLS